MYTYIYIYIHLLFLQRACLPFCRMSRVPVRWALSQSGKRASFQKFNMVKRARPLGDLNFQRACWSENKQWFWDLRPSTCGACVGNPCVRPRLSRASLSVCVAADARTPGRAFWVFRDVVFQDVGFQNTMFKTPHPYQLWVWSPHAFSFWGSINYHCQTPRPQTPHPWNSRPLVPSRAIIVIIMCIIITTTSNYCCCYYHYDLLALAIAELGGEAEGELLVRDAPRTSDRLGSTSFLSTL